MSNNFKLKGQVHKIMPEEKITDNFTKQDFVIKLDDRYTQYIKFQLIQDSCGLINRFDPGETVTVHFNIHGKEWKNSYFNNLNAWRITGEDQNSGTESRPPRKPVPPIAIESAIADDNEDLPF